MRYAIILLEYIAALRRSFGNYNHIENTLYNLIHMSNDYTVTGNLVDISGERIFLATVHVQDGRIASVEPLSTLVNESYPYITPGFIDAHVHVESSMLVPSQFARLAVVHGTVSTVSDPHEIANVCGVDGVKFMLDDAARVPFKFCFGAPSCVPATEFETSGATLGVEDVRNLLTDSRIGYLTEVMNYPGVLQGDADLLAKIDAAKVLDKPIDGHAPGLRGKDVVKYAQAGITTDHECFSKDEALDKLNAGMIVQIREGSAAKNFESLVDLLHEFADRMMFCSDDKHPDSLIEGHINKLCARALNHGINLFSILRAACVNPVKHYKLDVGLLQPGDPADFVVLKDLKTFDVIKCFIDGQLVAAEGKTMIVPTGPSIPPVNSFNCVSKQERDYRVLNNLTGNLRVIRVEDGQLITGDVHLPPSIQNDEIVADADRDILKICVVNRYHDAPVATAFINNFGLKNGAFASSVAHDSHNIVVVGVDDHSIKEAVDLIISNTGGISYVGKSGSYSLALPIGGLMADTDGYEVAEAYTWIDKQVKSAGCHLSAPFMSLSFMALLVIPSLKLSDKGLFDVAKFQFI